MLEYGLLLGEFLSGGTAGSGDFVAWAQSFGDGPYFWYFVGAAAGAFVLIWFWR